MILVGSAIEAASQEMEKVGTEDKPEFKPKYTMQQLLDDNFRLPLNGKGAETNEDEFFGDLMGFDLDEVS